MNNIKLIRTEDLSLADLPSPYADWHQLSLFALTFDIRSEIGNTKIPEDIAFRKLKDSYNLKELRTYLYNMQRWWNNKTTKIEDSALKEMQRGVELMRVKLTK